MRPVMVPIAIVALSVLLWALGGQVEAMLGYERTAILDGTQLWRLVTAHLLHLNAAHLGMNALALVLVWALVGGAMSTWHWTVTCALIAAGTGLGLLALVPTVTAYVGLSGVLHGLVVAGALAQLPRRRAESALLLAGVACKVVYEFIAGPSGISESLIGGRVIHEAHAIGAVCGLVPGTVLITSRRR